MITIRKYRPEDERDWVRCRVLSMLDTTLYSDVLTAKPDYPNPAVSVVADHGGRIVGLLDVEYDLPDRTVCYRGRSPGGIIRSLAVLPEYRCEQVATHLLKYACSLLREEGIAHLEAWSRLEDESACIFLQRRQFQETYRYLHFSADGPACTAFAPGKILDCFILRLYGEYTGSDPDRIREMASRTWDCALFEREI